MRCVSRHSGNCSRVKKRTDRARIARLQIRHSVYWLYLALYCVYSLRKAPDACLASREAMLDDKKPRNRCRIQVILVTYSRGRGRRGSARFWWVRQNWGCASCILCAVRFLQMPCQWQRLVIVWPAINQPRVMGVFGLGLAYAMMSQAMLIHWHTSCVFRVSAHVPLISSKSIEHFCKCAWFNANWLCRVYILWKKHRRCMLLFKGEYIYDIVVLATTCSTFFFCANKLRFCFALCDDLDIPGDCASWTENAKRQVHQCGW